MSAPSPTPPRRLLGGAVLVVAVVTAIAVLVAGIGVVVWATYTMVHNGGIGFSGHDRHKLRPAEHGPMPPHPADLTRFYDQELSWHRCGGSECTTLTVPLDYAKPTGRTIELAVLRVPARNRAHRVGQLVVDPGGPGVSAQKFAAAGAAAVGDAVAQSYDVVGMDPRGVGKSTPLTCLGTAGTDRLLAADAEPTTPAQVRRFVDLNRDLGRACQRHSGALLGHVSTLEAAKDMDVLRAALGEKRLDYFGGSYGTFLGATYAQLFPTHIRRMVLDGAMDPKLSSVQLALGQAHGFETAVRSYVADCQSRAGCPLSGGVDQGTAQLKDLLTRAEQKPLRTGTSRPLTGGLAYLAMTYPLYLQQLWPQLTIALDAALRRGDGAPLLALADQFTSRGAHGYAGNSNVSIYAVNCLDHDDYVPSSRVPSYFPAFDKASPTFGRIFAWGLASCADWPVQSHRRTHAVSAKGAPPIVVIGTTRDPATPYAWAKSLATQLSSARLITRDGDGHTGFNRGNPCVDDAVNRYLLTGRPPRPDLHC